MTDEQRAATKNAQTAFIAALDADVEEDLLIEAMKDAAKSRQLYIAAQIAMVEMFKSGVRWFEQKAEREAESHIKDPENTSA